MMYLDATDGYKADSPRRIYRRKESSKKSTPLNYQDCSTHVSYYPTF